MQTGITDAGLRLKNGIWYAFFAAEMPEICRRPAVAGENKAHPAKEGNEPAEQAGTNGQQPEKGRTHPAQTAGLDETRGRKYTWNLVSIN